MIELAQTLQRTAAKQVRCGERPFERAGLLNLEDQRCLRSEGPKARNRKERFFVRIHNLSDVS